MQDTLLKVKIGAGDGVRTRDIKLGKLALYQLSYSRLLNIIKELKKEIKCNYRDTFTGARVAPSSSNSLSRLANVRSVGISDR